MIEGTSQNLLSIEDLVRDPVEKKRANSLAMHEDSRPSGIVSLPVVGRFPDLDRMVSEGQDAGASPGPSCVKGKTDKSAIIDKRQGRWISQKLSVQFLAGVGLLLLFAAIALFPHTKTKDQSDTSLATKSKPSALPAAIAAQPVEVRKSAIPDTLPRVATTPGNPPVVKGRTENSPLVRNEAGKQPSGDVVGKTAAPPQDNHKALKPDQPPTLQVADRRSDIAGKVSTVNPAVPDSRPALQGTVIPGGAIEGGPNGDFVNWPRPANHIGGGSGIPHGAGFQPVLQPNNRGAGPQPAAQPATPPPSRVSLLRNPYI
jgi:hypothetical protein